MIRIAAFAGAYVVLVLLIARMIGRASATTWWEQILEELDALETTDEDPGEERPRSPRWSD